MTQHHEPTRTPVRVGVVVWNAAAYVGECLRALPAAFGPVPFEVVVVDNASGDDTAAVVEAAGAGMALRVVRNDRNVGYARAMNQALAGGGAEVLVALNPDTRPGSGSLQRLVAALLADPGAAVVSPRLVESDGSPQPHAHRFPSVRTALAEQLAPAALARRGLGDRWLLAGSRALRSDATLVVDWTVGAVHVIRVAALAGESPYDERTFMYGEDLDLCWRLHRRGWRTLRVGAVSVEHAGNVAGEVVFGAAREADQAAALCHWLRRERGAVAARAFAGVQLVVLAAKWLVLAGVGARVRNGAARRAQVSGLLRAYARSAVRGPRLPAALAPRG